MSLSAIVPVLDGKEHLARSLPALTAGVPDTLLEVLVVDDGSTDGSAELARSLGARVVETGARGRGPAYARNLGAQHVRGDVLLFVDADVVVEAGALERVARAFDDPGVGAVYGSYDASPPHRGFASRYMNLRHHYGHRVAADGVPTFWSGLGAVRRELFEAAGGFDAEAFPCPSIEDIDLGRRLCEAGARIRRDPAIQGKHLKRWTWRGVVHTDVVRRALPWARLMLRHPGVFTDLNVGRTERAKALLAAAFLTVTVLALAGLAPAWLALALLAAVVLANVGLALVFWRGGGALFSLAGTLFHQVYYVYSAATYLWCVVRRDEVRA